MGRINSRAKGAAGEREFIKELGEYLGDQVLKRNLEQTRVGGHDIVGLDGWAIEIKRYRAIKEGDIATFWDQAVAQAQRVDATPVLAYREDFRSWQVRVPLSVFGVERTWTGLEWTAVISVEAFAWLVRDNEPRCTSLHSSESPSTVAPSCEGACAPAQ